MLLTFVQLTVLSVYAFLYGKAYLVSTEMFFSFKVQILTPDV